MLKRHPYILATVVATLLAIGVWLCVPKEYSAVTKVSDEYKEVDLAIGMNAIMAQIKSTMGADNSGMNDIEVYSKVLNTESFARAISHKQVPGKNMTYGEYLGKKDTIEAVQERINYNLSVKQATLTISFSDRDSFVASQMLDSVTAQLQQVVTDYRHSMAEVAFENVKRELSVAKADYDAAQAAYARFVDKHSGKGKQDVVQQELALEQAAKLASDHYQDVSSQYARQQALMQRSYLSFAVIQENTVPVKDNRNLALYFFAILFLMLLAMKGLLLYHEGAEQKWDFSYGDFFSPWSLTLFIWAADIALYYIQGTMDAIGPKFVYCLTVWLLTLLPASYLSYFLTQKHPASLCNDYSFPISVPRVLFHVLCVISGLLTLVYAVRVWGIVSQFDMENLLYNLRLYIVEDNSVTGLLNHVQGLNFALFVVGIWMYPKISKWQLAYIVLVNLVFEIFRMEKSGILIMILGTMFLLYERKAVKIRTILLAFAGIIVLFFFFNLSKEEADTEAETTFLDFFGMYVTSPMVAFDHLFPDLSGNFGENTFCIIYPYLNMLGADLTYTDRLQEFVWVPIPTNVYTVMQPFYNDFGVPGVAFFGIVYGAFFGWVYRRFREGSPVFICIYTYLIEVILIQFYNDNLLQNIVLFMEFSFCVMILTQRKFNLSLVRHDES